VGRRKKNPLLARHGYAVFSLQLVISEALPALTVLFQGGICIISSGLFFVVINISCICSSE